MQLRRTRLVQSVAVLALSLGVCASAHADEASGTWTGAFRLRGNYYWERSTRVVAPEGGLELTAPNGVRMHADYLVDTITSASIASGVLADIRFTEVRHDVRAGAGYSFEIGETLLDIDANGRVSYEPDYDSVGGGISTTLSLDDRATELRLDVGYGHDSVGKILRGAQRMVDGRDLSDRGQIGTLDVLSVGLTWAQTISPDLIGEVGYDFAGLWGFSSNGYRAVSVQGVITQEVQPDTRFRHAIHGRLAYFIRPSSTAIHVSYRAYIDSWDIGALSPELRVYQELGDSVVLRTRYRFYAQTAAFFWQPAGDYVIGDPYITADPKMAAFHTHLLGLSALLKLDFLDGTALHFARQLELDLAFDYLWNTNRYGNGVIASVGLRAPF